MEPKKLIVSALLTMSLLTSLVLPIESSQSNPSGGTGNDTTYATPKPSSTNPTSGDSNSWIKISPLSEVDPEPWV